MDIEGQLCWTGTVRRPGGKLLGGGWSATIAIEQIAQSVVTWSQAVTQRMDGEVRTVGV